MRIIGNRNIIEEYFNDTSISQSALKSIVFSGEKPKKETIGLLKGSMVDILLTQEDKGFNEIYYVSNIVKFPSEAIMNIMKSYIDTYGVIMDDKNLLNIIRENDYNSRQKDENVLNTVKIKGLDYFNELVNSKNKIVISLEQFSSAVKLKQRMLSNSKTGKYFKDNDNSIIIYQVPLYFEYKGLKMKALLDGLYIDLEKKTYYIFDIKTIGMPIIRFIDNFIKFRYDFQLAFYQNAIKIVGLKNVLNYYSIDSKEDFILEDPKLVVGSFDDMSNPNVFTFTEVEQTMNGNYTSSLKCVNETIDDYIKILNNDNFDILSNEDELFISRDGIKDNKNKILIYGRF